MPNETTKVRRTSQQKIDELKKKQQDVLETAKKKQSQLQAQIKTAEAKIKTAERKKDTRRKVIAGAIALEHMKHDIAHAETMKRLISKYVLKDDEIELFEEYLTAELETGIEIETPVSVKSDFEEKLTG